MTTLQRIADAPENITACIARWIVIATHPRVFFKVWRFDRHQRAIADAREAARLDRIKNPPKYLGQ